jgi:hypothetical protein
MIPCKHIVIVRHGRERVFGLELSLTTFWSGHTHTGNRYVPSWTMTLNVFN